MLAVVSTERGSRHEFRFPKYTEEAQSELGMYVRSLLRSKKIPMLDWDPIKKAIENGSNISDYGIAIIFQKPKASRKKPTLV